jgi:hypothetical protein
MAGKVEKTIKYPTYAFKMLLDFINKCQDGDMLNNITIDLSTLSSNAKMKLGNISNDAIDNTVMNEINKDGKVSDNLPSIEDHLMDKVNVNPTLLPNVDNFNTPGDQQITFGKNITSTKPQPVQNVAGLPICPDSIDCSYGGVRCSYYPAGSENCNKYRSKKFK